MQIYVVGGALRDELLGLPVQDRDHVVVGATPEQMVAAGFKPVGRDFPVFLHPRSREEYALARTERKTGRGYAGFSFHAAPDVTLEEDLLRRDLTVNAMARGEDGVLVDPHGGRRDLDARVLRHVSEAFAEDPVRILRVARFAARFTDFEVAPETLALMQAMTAAGEVDALVAERVWQELSRGLMEARPSRMLGILEASGALGRLLPALTGIWSGAAPAQGRGTGREGLALRAEALAAVDAAADAGCELPVRFAVLVWPLGSDLPAVCEGMRVPVAVRELAMLVAGLGPALHELAADLEAARPITAPSLLSLIERADGLRKPDRFAQCLQAQALIEAAASAAAPPATCPADASADAPTTVPASAAPGAAGATLLTRPVARILLAARAAAMSVDAGRVAREGPAATIRDRIQAARGAAIAAGVALGGSASRGSVPDDAADSAAPPAPGPQAGGPGRA